MEKAEMERYGTEKGENSEGAEGRVRQRERERRGLGESQGAPEWERRG